MRTYPMGQHIAHNGRYLALCPQSAGATETPIGRPSRDGVTLAEWRITCNTCGETEHVLRPLPEA